MTANTSSSFPVDNATSSPPQRHNATPQRHKCVINSCLCPVKTGRYAGSGLPILGAPCIHHKKTIGCLSCQHNVPIFGQSSTLSLRVAVEGKAPSLHDQLLGGKINKSAPNNASTTTRTPAPNPPDATSHLDPATNQCTPPRCSCANGKAFQGVLCPGAGRHFCRVCADGFHLEVLNAETGYEERRCVENVCHCRGGVPAERGPACPVHGLEACAQCGPGYSWSCVFRKSVFIGVTPSLRIEIDAGARVADPPGTGLVLAGGGDF